MERYDIERYLNVRNASGPSLGPDGRLTFLMDTTGTPQIWSLSEPGTWPEQHTFFDDRITHATFSPERSELIFGKDAGGNERAQLHRLDLSTGQIRNLTQRPDAKHYWGGWSHDGERFAFASNRRDHETFDVYVQDRDELGGEAELVCEGETEEWLHAAGWGPDGERLLVRDVPESYDTDLYVVDIATGERHTLSTHDGEVRYASPEWGPDGDAVYCITDHATDTLRLERIDLETGEFSVVEEGGEWNVTAVTIDEDSRRVVYTRNVDGYTDVTAGELVAPDRIDPFPEPDLPECVAGGATWGPDGNRFAITVTSRSENANVYLVNPLSGETERWTNASTAGIPRDTFVDPELVHYPTFDDRQIPAFLSMPDEPAPEGGYPVIVDIHGGPAAQRRPSFSSVRQYLVNHGYAVFEPNVRGSSGYGQEYAALDDIEKRMDSVQDIRAGVEWLHDHPEVDSDRIAAYGGSYGGFMVLAAITEYPDLWAAAVDVVGIANFVTFLENTGDWRQTHREAEYGSLADDREFLESISPINNIESIECPLFVLHGENDPRVPVGEAEQIVEKARDQGVPVRKLIFEDEGHGFAKLENRKEAYRAVVEFLDETV